MVADGLTKEIGAGNAQGMWQKSEDSVITENRGREDGDVAEV